MAYTPNISGLADKNPLYNTKTVVMDGITFGEFTVGNFNQGSVYQRSSSKWVNSTNTWKAVVNAVDIDWCEAALTNSGRTISSTGQLLSLVDEIFGKFSSYATTASLSTLATAKSVSDLTATVTSVQSTANTAKSTADTAKSTAEAAKSAAETNASNISTLSDKVKALESKDVVINVIPTANIDKICI